VKVGAILLCAGRGQRLGRPQDKPIVPLAGRPLFAWSLAALQETPVIQAIVIVGSTTKLRQALAGGSLSDERVVAWCEGGRERQESVVKGLAAMPKEFDLVAIHDSARALVTPEVIGRVIADAMQHGAAIAAVPLDDTLKRGSVGSIERTVPRAGLWRAQTPQAFRREWLDQAHAESRGAATDDASLVEVLGHRVRLTPGDPMNFKITAPRDLEMAEACLIARQAKP